MERIFKPWFKKAYDLLNHKKIIDLRNLIDKNEAIKLGFEYQGVGRWRIF